MEAINVIEGNGGGVVGDLFGSQIGDDNGKTAAQIAGVLGGAYVGRNIERNARQTKHFDVVIRFFNGGSQTVQYANDPGLRIGEKVKINEGVLMRDN